MANASDPAKWFGEAEFTFDGEVYTITFNNMALLRAEAEVGQSMLEWLPRLQAAVNGGPPPLVLHLAAVVYGGLKNNHPSITLEDVAEMVMDENPSLRTAIAQALAAIEVPEEAVAEVGNANAPMGNRKARRAQKATTI